MTYGRMIWTTKKSKRKNECILKNWLKNTFEFDAIFAERSTSGAILCKYTNNWYVLHNEQNECLYQKRWQNKYSINSENKQKLKR